MQQQLREGSRESRLNSLKKLSSTRSTSQGMAIKIPTASTHTTNSAHSQRNANPSYNSALARQKAQCEANLNSFQTLSTTGRSQSRQDSLDKVVVPKHSSRPKRNTSNKMTTLHPPPIAKISAAKRVN